MTINEEIAKYKRAHQAAYALWRYHSEYLAGLVLKGINIKETEEYYKYLIVARDLHNINQRLDKLCPR